MATKQKRLTDGQPAPVAADPDAGLFFLDSGAFSLFALHAKKEQNNTDYSWYDTPEFWAYVDDYAAFVKEHLDVIDYYANVDVIFSPERSWGVLKYLENTHDLHPTPVIHCGTDVTWVRKHLDAGYAYLGVGGAAQGVPQGAYRAWADKVFTLLCPGPSHLPVVKTHGFAMTAYDLLFRYPWFSVDSATWTKVGAFGGILVPHRRNGRFVFTEQPYQIAVSEDSPATKEAGRHYRTLKPFEREVVDAWLAEIKVPLGKVARDARGRVVLTPDKKGKPKAAVLEFGVTSRHSERKIANLLFFEKLRKSLPDYPWPFRHARAGGGLFPK